MQLLSVDHGRADGADHIVRVTARLRSSSGIQSEVWVEIERKFEHLLTRSGDPWLVLMVAYGALHKEDIEIDLPVDPILMRGVTAIAACWRQWYGRIHVPTIRATNIVQLPDRPPAQSASFFSGGIDSLFTALRHTPPIDRVTGAFFATDYLLRICHSRPLSAQSAKQTRDFEEFAEKTGKIYLPVATNVMTFSERIHDRFGSVTHGAVLSFVAHLLGTGLSKTLIASSDTYGALSSWGSHPLTDPLFSSTSVRMMHDGAQFTRFDKTAYLALHPVAHDIINVCDTEDELTGKRNCSKCRKCLRTMTAFDILGVRPAAFDWSGFDPESYARVHFSRDVEWAYGVELISMAERIGRNDIVRSLTRGIRRSRRLWWLDALTDPLRDSEFVLRRKPQLLTARNQLYSALGVRAGK